MALLNVKGFSYLFDNVIKEVASALVPNGEEF